MEKITPFAQADKSLNSPIYKPYILKGQYDFDPLEIDSAPMGKIPIPIIGGLIRGLTNTLADVFVSISQGVEVDEEIDPIDLSDIDFSLIQSLKITSLRMRVIKKSTIKPKFIFGKVYYWLMNKKANFKFLKTVELIAYDHSPGENESKTFVIASFDYQKNYISDTKRTIDFSIHNNKRLLKVLKRNSVLKIIPKVSVRSIPKRYFKATGTLKYELAIYSPFLPTDEKK